MRILCGKFARALTLVSVCLAITTALAQYRASIRGVVTDPQGATISGATVTLTNKETNQVFTTTTDASGIYNFSALPPSKFSLSVEMTGFKKKVLNNVAIIPDRPTPLTSNSTSARYPSR